MWKWKRAFIALILVLALAACSTEASVGPTEAAPESLSAPVNDAGPEASGKTDSTQLMTGNWAPATRARIQAVIDANANQGRYVCFDVDNTTVMNDMGEALLVYQIENLRFALTPDNIVKVITIGITDMQEPIGQTVDGKDVSTEAVVADILEDYKWLYENYAGFGAGGQYDLDYIHASTQYQDFSTKLFFLYYFGGQTYNTSVVYPWVGHLFTGMTPDEVYALAADSHTYWSNYTYYTVENWTSPINWPGQAGIVSIQYRTGVVFLEEMIDLYQTLQANGIGDLARRFDQLMDETDGEESIQRMV